jgi:hypothetical protein
MNRPSLARDIAEDLVLHDWALALWEGGSAAFGRADDLSDLDLVLAVEDGKVEDAVKIVEAVMERQGGFRQKWEVPQPAWHGCWQAFYRPEADSPYFMLDICIAERSKPWILTERQRHGEPLVLFDRIGAATPTDMAAEDVEKIVQSKLPQLEGALEMFADFPAKELERGRLIDAIYWHQTLVLGRVVGLLRLRHAPERHDYGFRYLYFDLPESRANLIEELLFVRDADDLRAKTARALALGREVAGEIRAAQNV